MVFVTLADGSVTEFPSATGVISEGNGNLAVVRMVSGKPLPVAGFSAGVWIGYEVNDIQTFHLKGFANG
ncbi:hypothetical protein HOT82_gp045 [Gordonia phage Ronaldo]|uniref:Uncharacterized protein n=3 Tax=Ronaldovirus ronaldo TaxID=2734270 RepID=A0A6B9L8V2_9CAUD|nr:hypothetical protein HOT82_gp045 [Gordonia phage Ronaldo]AXN53607.1 hypothetical protein SEA_RONALDO_45 [Gordonia phage Ronaldo]QDH48384.1 hypothetical protein SEA_ZIKO_45 [Gordonia phage Ziko]QHB38160.1 hypothetical protein SEA_VOLT_44 [Gordonia phage Volt]QTF81832.1 hypothetical protein SEA_GUEY18_47 [Gordonia phage Guey18]